MGITSKKTGAFFRLNVEKDVWELTDILLQRTVLISRKELFTAVVEFSKFLVFELTEGEEADILEWASQPIKLAIEERFLSKGFTWHEMEQWAAGCYRMNSNPIPRLRDILAEYFSDAVYYVSVLKCREWPRTFLPGLTCIHDQRNSSPKSPVTLIAHGTFEELEQRRAEKARMRRIAGIS